MCHCLGAGPVPVSGTLLGGVTVGRADAIPAYCPHMRPCVCSSPLPLFFIRTHILYEYRPLRDPLKNVKTQRSLEPKCKDSSSLFVFIPNKYREFLQVLDLHISHSMAFGIALTNIAPACYLVCFCQQPGGLR